MQSGIITDKSVKTDLINLYSDINTQLLQFKMSNSQLLLKQAKW